MLRIDNCLACDGFALVSEKCLIVVIVITVVVIVSTIDELRHNAEVFDILRFVLHAKDVVYVLATVKLHPQIILVNNAREK